MHAVDIRKTNKDVFSVQEMMTLFMMPERLIKEKPKYMR